MNNRFVALHADDPVSKAVELLTEELSSGMPVVDDKGAVVGMISELALIDVVFDATAKDAPVSAYMARDIHVVHPGEPLSRVAQLFALYFFAKVAVVDQGKLVGMVTCRDLMNYALRTGEVLTEPLVDLIPTLAPLS
jgi:CBS domain-containing protein